MTQSLPADVIDAMISLALVLHTDAQYTITYANERLHSLLGYESGGLLGQPFLDLVGPDSAFFADWPQVRERMEAGETISSRLKISGLGGQAPWIKAGFRTATETGGMTMVGIEVTHSELREREMRERLNAIENTQIVVEFMAGGMILSANEIFCHRMGYDSSELICEDARKLQPESLMGEAAYQDFWSDRDMGLPFSGELHFINSCGDDIYLQGAMDPITDQWGNIDRIVLYATDVTARKFALDRLKKSITKLREGSMDAEIYEQFELELEPLREDFNQMVSQLSTLVSKIAREAIGVERHSQDMEGMAHALADRSVSQADTLAQTSGIIRTISSRVNNTASNAEFGSRVADNGVTLVQTGRDAVLSVAEAMRAIEHVAQQISQFTKLIDSISLQSKILGLNAAVEAARAGDAGRGFAVVANEVRSLAAKTADAASEINDLVESIGARVAAASDRVTASGSTISQVISAVEDIRRNIVQIAQDTSEQAQSISAFSSQIAALDTLTRENNQLAEEAAKTSGDLRSKADALNRHVSYFTAHEPMENADFNAPDTVTFSSARRIANYN